MMVLKHYEKELILTDSQKILIIKFADLNNDSTINYPEFLHFLEIINKKFPDNDNYISNRPPRIRKSITSSFKLINDIHVKIDKQIENFDVISKNTMKIKEIDKIDEPLQIVNQTMKKNEFDRNLIKEIDTTKLKDCFNYNNLNTVLFENDPLYFSLFKLQRDIHSDLKAYYTIIEEFYKISTNVDIIPLDALVKVLEKCKI